MTDSLLEVRSHPHHSPQKEREFSKKALRSLRLKIHKPTSTRWLVEKLCRALRRVTSSFTWTTVSILMPLKDLTIYILNMMMRIRSRASLYISTLVVAPSETILTFNKTFLPLEPLPPVPREGKLYEHRFYRNNSGDRGVQHHAELR